MGGPSRRDLLTAAGVAGAAALPGETQAAAPSGKRPNVVVILLDDLGFADLGCYGGEIRTPAIDALAAGGLLYTDFHTTGVCSPSRASLITGMNPHSVGMGYLTDADAGTPGYRGDLSHDAATLAEHLRAGGWSTFHVGKWHLNSFRTDTNFGPGDNWPLQRGFDRAYWFHGHSSDYFRPAEMREDNTPVEIVPSDDYYLTDDLTDRAIGWIREHAAMAPERPFFLYLAHAAPHSPIQARREDRDSYRGAYDAGWDVVRERRFARQKALGLVPADAALPPRDPNVKPWAELTPGEQRLNARYMEVYAGVVQRIDWNIARLMAALEEAGLGDDTLVVLMSDNGGSPDAGPRGTTNLLASPLGGVSTEQALAQFDEIGGPDTCPVYPLGWAMVSSTPFRMYKHHTFGGGVCDPMILRWPGGVAARGETRGQYVHISDVCPTILDAAGCPPLRRKDGRPLKPIEGLSFASTFASARAPAVRREQYFELEGKRAFYADGWKIVSARRYGEPLEADRWELFHLETDFNETTDLAAHHPQRLRELERRWWAAARRHQVLPMDLRTTAERYFADLAAGGGRGRWDFTPPLERVLVAGAPPFLGRTHSLEAEVEAGPDANGVLAAYGNLFLGFVLYVKDGRPVYEIGARPHRWTMTADVRLRPGRNRVRVVQTMAQRPSKGSAALWVNDRKAAEIAYPRVPFGKPYQGLEIGRNGAVPASLDYTAPFPFTGRIVRVTAEVDTSPYTEAEWAALTALFKR